MIHSRIEVLLLRDSSIYLLDDKKLDKGVNSLDLSHSFHSITLYSIELSVISHALSLW